MIEVVEMCAVLVIIGIVSGTQGDIVRPTYNKRQRLENYRTIYKNNDLMNDINELSDIVIPIIINIDHILLSQYSNIYKTKSMAKRVLRTKVRNVTKGISKAFRQPSLGHNIKLNVLDVNFLKNTSRLSSPDSSKYLNSFCSWQARRKEEGNMWYSVLLTGLDLYYVDKRGKKVMENQARSFRNGMCHTEKSCAVAEGNLKNLVHTLTHEIGHSLAIRHDGDGNTCSKEDYIMAPKLNRNKLPNSWSPCSAKYLDSYLRSKRSWCLK